jgi:hypothetical protein
MISKQYTSFFTERIFLFLKEFLARKSPKLIRGTQLGQREYHVAVTRPKHRVPRPPPEPSLTYIPRTKRPDVVVAHQGTCAHKPLEQPSTSTCGACAHHVAHIRSEQSHRDATFSGSYDRSCS